MPAHAPDLRDLYDVTQVLTEDHRAITRALDWVDRVLPAFANACRLSLHGDSPEILDTWLRWLDSESIEMIEEAGKGEVYRWRHAWLKLLVSTSHALQLDRQWQTADGRAKLANRLGTEHSALPSCFPCAFWHDLLDYLSDPSPDPRGHRATRTGQNVRHSVTFPLVLSEPVVDGGHETNVILAEFVLERTSRTTGDVLLHPEQAAVRCMDEQFANGFAQAALMARESVGKRPEFLPDVRARIQPVKPGHERFLHGTVLRGPSGAGALAIALNGLYRDLAPIGSRLAVSFALSKPGAFEVDGNCHVVGGTDDKVRGCAKQGMTHLLVAKEQQSQIALYGYKHGIEVVGAATFAEAAALVAGLLCDHAVPAASAPRRVVLLYNRHAEQDAYLSRVLESRLFANGHDVFVDRHLPVGIAWAQEIERQIRNAEAIIPLLSEASMRSDMLEYEIEKAHEAAQVQDGLPRLLPVRVAYTGPLPDGVAYILDPLQHALWNGAHDDERLVAEIERALRRKDEIRGGEIHPNTPAPPEAALDALEPFDGLVPLQSRFYIARETDRDFGMAVAQRHSVILLKGSRQVGKSSLLVRGLDQAERSGARVALTDFQKLSAADLRSVEAFYKALARMLARQLNVQTALDDGWKDGRSANLNFEEYMEDYVLPRAAPLFWAMDEVDRLFAFDFGSDVFGLFRSWTNERQGRSTSPWTSLTMAIAYATEAHLFIRDLNQSPFNIGTRFELRDFTVHEVADLNERYGSPLNDDMELARFYYLVGGHPYLVRRGLYTMMRHGMGIAAFEEEADRDDGPVGDHLRRILTLLARSEENLRAVQEMLRGQPCPTYEAFYHLRSAGVIVGDSARSARPRCQLYQSYLEDHLL